MFAVRLHATGCSLRETQAILRLVGVERFHQVIWNWAHRLADSVPDPPRAKPSRVAVDDTAVKINGDWSWVYAAIDLDSRLISDAAVFGRRRTDHAAAFLHRLTEKHDLSETMFLVDGYGYLTSLFRLGLSGQLDVTWLVRSPSQSALCNTELQQTVGEHQQVPVATGTCGASQLAVSQTEVLLRVSEERLDPPSHRVIVVHRRFRYTLSWWGNDRTGKRDRPSP